MPAYAQKCTRRTHTVSRGWSIMCMIWCTMSHTFEHSWYPLHALCSYKNCAATSSLLLGIFSGLFLFHHKGLLHHSGVLIENLGYLYNDSLENLRHLYTWEPWQAWVNLYTVTFETLRTFTMYPWEPWEPLLGTLGKLGNRGNRGNLGNLEALRQPLQCNHGNLENVYWGTLKTLSEPLDSNLGNLETLTSNPGNIEGTLTI